MLFDADALVYIKQPSLHSLISRFPSFLPHAASSFFFSFLSFASDAVFPLPSSRPFSLRRNLGFCSVGVVITNRQTDGGGVLGYLCVVSVRK